MMLAAPEGQSSECLEHVERNFVAGELVVERFWKDAFQHLRNSFFNPVIG